MMTYEVPESRYYCPGCGEVHPGRYSYFKNDFIVEPHHVYRSTSEFENCPGGPVDKIADRAP